MATLALEIAPEQDSHVRSLAYFALASVYRVMEDYSHAAEAYQLAIQHGREAENPVAEMMSTVGLSLMAFEHGQLHSAFEIATAQSDRIERAGSLPPSARYCMAFSQRFIISGIRSNRRGTTSYAPSS